MRACGVIVEYNPFHYGHKYHIQSAREVSGSDCIIAVMSGSFLQRGEPAVIDKFYRTRAALEAGVDIIVELPYLYAVQSSSLFAYGSVQTLNELGVSSICFGSESGDISQFTKGYRILKKNQALYQRELREHLKHGLSFPEASRIAYQKIGLNEANIDLIQPNNILGFSYTKIIMDQQLPIQPLTINRIKSGYHDLNMSGTIASATSIRHELINKKYVSEAAAQSLPDETIDQLIQYHKDASLWHTWENYFNLLQYRVLTMPEEEIASIYGVDEGLEHRIKETAQYAVSLEDWLRKIKTKRYTWTRLQRVFTHILTNTRKSDAEYVKTHNSIPYVRLLGMNETGRAYLNGWKKNMNIPLISTLTQQNHPLAINEERATHAYYSILPPELKKGFHHQELKPPIMI